MNHAIENTWAAIAEDLVSVRAIHERLLEAASAGTWQDAIRLTLFDRLCYLADRLQRLVEQAKSARSFGSREVDKDFALWAAEMSTIIAALDDPFEIDVDDFSEGVPPSGTADVDAVLALLQGIRRFEVTEYLTYSPNPAHR